ncbi:UDP-N-acetylmuramate:L-alanyl-gamma-D-glutamyl-meso-diaminopimelate ligase [Acidiferrobacter sp.]
MRIHILGIGGTFMGGLALLARASGFDVTGSDRGIYPPMSDQLRASGIALTEGYDRLPQPAPDLVVIGNALSRGNPAVEEVLNAGIPYVSGPQWLAEHVLHDRFVIAVAGTHGKTTVTSIVTWILEEAGLEPGFLIGGVPQDFGVSARLTESRFFVVEADEYDTAFFDKRAKFVHYRPRAVILNNLEYDHADIYPDLASISRQFQHLLRIVPGTGLIVANGADPAIAEVLAAGAWTPIEYFSRSDGWEAELLAPDGSAFRVRLRGVELGTVRWGLAGRHNVANALAALSAARFAGVAPETALQALATFRGVKRRLEVFGSARGVTVYDDFAHHPTAIRATIEALKARVAPARVLAVLEPRSNTMRQGVHRETLGPSLAAADAIYIYAPPDIGWDVEAAVTGGPDCHAHVSSTHEDLIASLVADAHAGDHVLIMSNGGFAGLHGRLLTALGATS